MNLSPPLNDKNEFDFGLFQKIMVKKSKFLHDNIEKVQDAY
jgi:hypothetical protein